MGESRLQIEHEPAPEYASGTPASGARRRRMKQDPRIAVAALAAAVIAIAGVGGTAVASAVPPTAPLSVADVHPEVGAAEVDWPAGVAAAAFRVEGVDGAVGSAGEAGPLPMASIAKLLFGLVLLDAQPLAAGEEGASITLDDSDVAHLVDGVRDGASVLPVAVGDVLTQRQLLEAAMLMSASNAAMTLADWAFGSHDGYLAAAERYLAERGIEGIQVADASGLSDRGVASAAGLLQLMGAADREPALLEITGTATTTLPRVGQVSNTNEALGRAGIDSGKTGNLHAHGRTVLAGATRTVDGAPVRIHVALLGIQPGVDRGAAAAALVDSVVANVHWLTVLPAGAAVAQYDVPWDDPVALTTTSPIRFLHWRGATVTVTVDAPPEWRSEGAAALRVDSSATSWALEAARQPSEPSPSWRLQQAAGAFLAL
ncbi:hypothetical protein [Agrococcus sp. Marseille-Q4369]|uniref:hypothetical protein n=1 Tax=Agrococcus sp. Marseille-Q4369 TaxID=2810513 RepID=UPI001B8D0C1A|nr:hypothetical protein [Agrococcus sp. Marseille-Q4369]QUW18163.1 hypothetical protein JSQ78_09985 [Agrococcus sp. Marseille-Q4369]